MSGADNNRRTTIMARTVRTKVYKFSELSNEAKEKAIQQFWDVNVSYEWWESIYEDAANIGLKITDFDIDRGNCNGEFTMDADDVAKAIVENHGEGCQTYKTAINFIQECKAVIDSTPVVFDEGTEDEYEDYSDRNYQIEELEIAFRESLCEDYRIMLRDEYEYQTSEKQVIESIEANDYEFTRDGKQF